MVIKEFCYQKKKQLSRMTHQDLAHIGSTKTCDLIKERYYWRNMAHDIRSEISKCKFCAQRKNMPQDEHVDEHLTTGYQFENLSIYFAGPLPLGENRER